MIRILFRAAIQSKGRSIVSPFIYYFDAPQTVWKIGDRETCWLPIPLNIDAEAVTLKEEEPFAVDYVTGCCMLVPRLVLQQVGLFDERFFMYFEDADFCRRVRNAGFQLSDAPQAKMWHKVSLSAKKDRPGQRYWRTWGRVQFYLQHSHGMFPLLKHVYLWLLALYTTVIDVLGGDRNLVLPLWAGILDGYEHKNRRQKRYFRT